MLISTLPKIVRALTAGVGAVVLTVTVAAPPAEAHVGVVSSTPANGAQLPSAPEEVAIRFSMPVDLDTSTAELRYLGGPDTPVTEANRRDVRTDPLEKTFGVGAGTETGFTLPELGEGLYAIDWYVNEIDGHGNSSSILFRIVGTTPEVTSEETAPDVPREETVPEVTGADVTDSGTAADDEGGRAGRLAAAAALLAVAGAVGAREVQRRRK